MVVILLCWSKRGAPCPSAPSVDGNGVGPTAGTGCLATVLCHCAEKRGCTWWSGYADTTWLPPLKKGECSTDSASSLAAPCLRRAASGDVMASAADFSPPAFCIDKVCPRSNMGCLGELAVGISRSKTAVAEAFGVAGANTSIKSLRSTIDSTSTLSLRMPPTFVRIGEFAVGLFASFTACFRPMALCPSELTTFTELYFSRSFSIRATLSTAS
mmetsp:Transcript_23359/g.53862  ORF Transcript_23359/g.53862 Transcript_23359/m.53862 type:complete len:214 (+) Transcript_23359:402-1043(+)